MRFRALLAGVLHASAFGFAATPANTAKPPRCYGKVATQWVTEPGRLTANPGHDVFVGSNGDDNFESLKFPGGVDLFCGGGGNDSIDIIAAGNKADGGSGSDRLYTLDGAYVTGDDLMYVAAVGGSTAEGGSWNDTNNVPAGGTGSGGSGNDVLTVSGDDLSLYRGSGFDILENEGEDDILLICGSGSDLGISLSGTEITRRCEQVGYR